MQIYDLTTRSAAAEFNVGATPHNLSFNPSKPLLAVSTYEKPAAFVIDTQTGKILRELRHPQPTRGLAWTRTGDALAVACGDNNAYIWSLEENAKPHKYEGHQNLVQMVAFSPQGNLLCTTSFDGTSRFWDVRSGKSLLTVFGGTRGWSHDDQMGYVNQPKFGLAQVSSAHECQRLWTRQKLSDIRGLAPVINGNYLVTYGRKGVQLWHTSTGQELHTLYPGNVSSVVYHPSTGLLFDGDAGIFQQRLGASLETNTLEIHPPILLAHLAKIAYIALFPDARRVAYSQPEKKQVGIFDLASRQTIHTIRNDPGSDSLAASPDGRWLAIGGWQSADGLRVYETRSWSTVTSLSPEIRTISPVFSPDGKWLVACVGHEYQFYRTSDWRVRHRIARSGTGGRFGPISFSSDGRQCALLTTWTTAMVVDTETGAELGVFDASDDEQRYGLWLAPDGSRLVLSSATGSSLLSWDLRAVRARLKEMNLDWPAPALPAPSHFPAQPARIVVAEGPPPSRQNQ